MRLFSVDNLEFLKMNATMMRIHRYEGLKNLATCYSIQRKSPVMVNGSEAEAFYKAASLKRLCQEVTESMLR